MAARERPSESSASGWGDLLRQLDSFRTKGPTLADRTAALARVEAFLLDKPWNACVRRVLTHELF